MNGSQNTFRASSGRLGRRGLTLLVVATLVIGGGLAAAGGLLTRPSPSSRGGASPSAAVMATPSTTTRPSIAPTQEPPQGGRAEPVTRETLGANQSFLLADEHVGWAVTATAVYRTLDAGETWTDERPADWPGSAASALVDGQTAYLASDSLPMVMAVTHSGGASWSTATIDDRRIRGAPILSFQTPMKGFATFFDDDSETTLRVYATVDGGATWTGPSIGHKPTIEASLGKLQGPSGGVLYMVPGKYDHRPFSNRFVLSLDGGATWKRRSFPIGAESPRAVQKWITRLWVEPDGPIRVAIGADDRRSIWSSRDDGKTWHLQTVLPRNTSVDENGFLSSSEWIFALDSGSGFRFTIDAGAHWHTRKTIDDIRLDPATLSFASVDVGWALEPCWVHGGSTGGYCDGERPVLVSTKDGGRTWTPVGQPTLATAIPTPQPGAAGWAPAGMAVTNSDAGRGPGETALALADGRVLVIGGGHADSSAALYDPTAGRWTATGPMVHDRMGQAATLLRDGRVFVIGGSYDGIDHGTTEFFDPATGRWSRGPSMAHRKIWFQAVGLQDGRVLVVGVGPRGGVGTVTAEIYDPAAARWTLTGAPSSSRSGASPLVVLKDGRVLMAGGDDDHNRHLASAELYDPATGTWSATERMTEPRAWPMATLLLDGRVLVAGGAHSLAGRSLPNAEIFDPASGRWSSVASMSVAHDDASLRLLGDGRVLVAGGSANGFDTISTAEVYDPLSDVWSPTADLHEGRYGYAAVALDDGSVVVIGGHGKGSFHYLGSAERYYPDGVPAG